MITFQQLVNWKIAGFVEVHVHMAFRAIFSNLLFPTADHDKKVIIHTSIETKDLFPNKIIPVKPS